MKKISRPIYVTKSFLPPLEEYIKEIKFIWESSWLTNNGHLHNSLEKLLSEHLKVQESTLFVNGTLALETVIEALDLKGEIITT
ncbi:DegT/DnrJ/EryC1/StrS family aminotransferase, partial [Priestia sp. BR_2]